MMKEKLKKEINYIIIIILFVSSCNLKRNNDSINNSNELNNYVKNNFQNYSSEYNLIIDSLNMYCDSGLKSFQTAYLREWQIDSLLIINSSKNMIVLSINYSRGIGAKGDQISKILGKKINGNWFFFMGGGHLHVPRDMYGKDEMHPLSFYELSQIARKEMLAGAVIEKNGKLIIDDEWIDEHFYNGGYYSFGKHRIEGIVQADEVFQMPRDKAKFDSVHWQIIMDKWKHKIDTNEYKPLQRKQFKKVNS